MVVSGLEIVALVMAIISGFNAADGLIKSMKERLQKQKDSRSATAIQRLDTILRSTINGRDDVQPPRSRTAEEEVQIQPLR